MFKDVTCIEILNNITFLLIKGLQPCPSSENEKEFLNLRFLCNPNNKVEYIKYFKRI